MTSAKPLRILIVDDHPVVLQGLAAMIAQEQDMVVVAGARNGREAIEMHCCFRPDVTLVDLRLPDMSGVDVVEAIRQAQSDAGCIVLSVFGGDEDIYRALRKGARAYLQKDVTQEELVRAIRAVARGNRYLPTTVAAHLADRIAGSNPTPRELAVLQLIASGKSNKEIAADLSVGEGTVKTHVNNVMRKLGVTSRTQAILAAVQRGLVHMGAKRHG